ncbi:MAG: DUF2490 domain-containing protein [candidate division WOR-3 bacterium]|nr:MAG: DUF2490 domain-containing protein [candidate division WOR-3 bacterium]
MRTVCATTAQVKKTDLFRIVSFLFVMVFIQPHAGNGATTGRFWSYLNLTSVHSPNWAIVAMPGLRYEFARSDDPSTLSPKGVYFYEFFIGPVYTLTTGALTLKLPIWYYYMGFPTPDDYFYSHNIEFLPILNYRLGRFTLTSRTIFHNTLYASVYESPEMRNGYSMVIRQLLQLSYSVNTRMNLIIADEPFFGAIEDSDAPPSAAGFWPQGFRLNRLYLGCAYKMTLRITISPQYVLETAYDGGSLTDTNHYFFVTVSYTL